MTEDQLRALFGTLDLVPALMWVGALFTFLAFAALILAMFWKKLSAFVAAVNLMINLDAKFKGIEGTLERVRAQVENSHSTNLRDELDRDRLVAEQRHDEVIDQMRGMKKDIGRIDDRELALAIEIDQVRAALGSRIGHLENTFNPKEN